MNCPQNKPAIEEFLLDRCTNVGSFVYVQPDHKVDNLSTIAVEEVVTTAGAGGADVPYKNIVVQWPFAYGYFVGEMPTDLKRCHLKGFDPPDPPKKKQKTKASNPQTASIRGMEQLVAIFRKEPDKYGDYFTNPFKTGTSYIQITMLGTEKTKLITQLYTLWFQTDRVARLRGELLNLKMADLQTDEVESLTQATYKLWQRLTKESIQRNR